MTTPRTPPSRPPWSLIQRSDGRGWSRCASRWTTAPRRDPGEVFAYSDTGYILLGEMIERATGTSLADAYRTLLDFDGLGLEATYLESVEPVPPGSAARAHQYFDELDTFDFDPSFDLYGGGGLVSTVDDLSVFYRALVRGEVFTDPDTLDMMLDMPASNAGPQAGMGIFRLYVEGNECWSHAGFWGTFVLTCPDLDVTIAASLGTGDARRTVQRRDRLPTRLPTRHVAVTSETPRDTPAPERMTAMAGQTVTRIPAPPHEEHKRADLSASGAIPRRSSVAVFGAVIERALVTTSSGTVDDLAVVLPDAMVLGRCDAGSGLDGDRRMDKGVGPHRRVRSWSCAQPSREPPAAWFSSCP